MTDNTHNGQTNYATWRVALECFDGMDSCKGMTADDCQELVMDFIYDSADPVRGWAIAFLSEVNWYEIAEHLSDEEE